MRAPPPPTHLENLGEAVLRDPDDGSAVEVLQDALIEAVGPTYCQRRGARDLGEHPDAPWFDAACADRDGWLDEAWLRARPYSSAPTAAEGLDDWPPDPAQAPAPPDVGGLLSRWLRTPRAQTLRVLGVDLYELYGADPLAQVRAAVAVVRALSTTAPRALHSLRVAVRSPWGDLGGLEGALAALRRRCPRLREGPVLVSPGSLVLEVEHVGARPVAVRGGDARSLPPFRRVPAAPRLHRAGHGLAQTVADGEERPLSPGLRLRVDRPLELLPGPTPTRSGASDALELELAPAMEAFLDPAGRVVPLRSRSAASVTVTPEGRARARLTVPRNGAPGGRPLWNGAPVTGGLVVSPGDRLALSDELWCVFSLEELPVQHTGRVHRPPPGAHPIEGTEVFLAANDALEREQRRAHDAPSDAEPSERMQRLLWERFAIDWYPRASDDGSTE